MKGLSGPVRTFWKTTWLRDVLSSLSFFTTLVALDFLLRALHEGTGITPSTSPIPRIYTVAWAILLTALVRLPPRWGNRVAMGLVGGVSTLLFLVHSLLACARSTFFSFSALIFAEDGFRYLDASYLQARKMVWITFVCGILGTVLSVILAPPSRRKWWDRGIALCIIVLCIVCIRQNREENLTDRLAAHVDMNQVSLLYDVFSNPNECVMLTGLYQYTFRDFCLTYGVYDFINRAENQDIIAELDDWYASKEPDPDNEWTGRFQGKNLIMIQLEAIDTWLINEQFMPNLYRIQQESLDFTQNYTPMYLDAGTFNTEMIVNTGLISPFVGSTSSMYSRNAYPDSLAHLMRNAGYSANSFHRSTGETYNRGEVHENIGYSHYYSGEEMGIWNLDFDTELMAGYDLFTANAPFLSFIITFSGHGPYENSAVSAQWYDYAASLLPADTEPMVIHAYAHAYETDRFIGMLYDRLEADGRLDDTVLVFYADHYDYYVLDTGIIMRQKDVYDTDLICRTPFFIYEKNTPPQKIEKVVSSMDILPTLVNLFGLDCDGTHYVGNDAFSDNGGYVIFPDYAWYDGTTYWTPLGDVPADEAISQRNEELKTRLQMSWDTMKTDYFAD